MESNNNTNGYRLITILALVFAIVGVSIGFAAFSQTLIINESTGVINQAKNVFDTGLNFSNAVIQDKDNALEGTSAGTASGLYWGDINVNLSEDRTSETFVGTISNETAYPAYLSSIDTGTNAKVSCDWADSDKQGSSDLLTAVCDSITVTYTFAQAKKIVNSTEFTESGTQVSVFNVVPAKIGADNGTAEVTIKVDGSSITEFPDEKVKITIPGVSLNFTSVKPSS